MSGDVVRQGSRLMGKAIVDVNSLDEKEIEEFNEFFNSFTLGTFLEIMDFLPEEYYKKPYVDAIEELFFNDNGVFEKAVEDAYKWHEEHDKEENKED